MNPSQRLPIGWVALFAGALVAGVWILGLEHSTEATPAATVSRAPRVAPNGEVEPSLRPLQDTERNEARAIAATRTAAPAEMPSAFLVGVVRGCFGQRQPISLRVVAVERIGRGLEPIEFEATRASSEPRVVRRLPNVAERRFDDGVLGEVDAAGRFRIDVTRLVGLEDGDVPALLAIRVHGCDAASTDFEVAVPVGDERFGRVSAYEIRAVLELTSPCGVQGRVVASASNRPRATVAAFAWEDQRPAAMPASADEFALAKGDFALPLDCDRDYVVVLLADGCRPWSQILLAGRSRQLGALVLERGEVISGRARIAGEAVRGVVRVRGGAASGSAAAVSCSITGRTLLWVGERFEWESLSVASGEDGRFEVGGLGPAVYALSLGAVSGVYASYSPPLEVQAPAASVQLSPRACRLELELFHDGELARNRYLNVSERSGLEMTVGSHRTNAFGVATLLVYPDRTTTITLAVSGDRRSNARTPPHRIDCVDTGRATPLRVEF